MLPNKNYNLALMTDSYKCSHWLQFPKDTKKLFYYAESRSENKNILFFGLQAIIKEYFIQVPTLEHIEFAKLFWDKHGFKGYFNYEGWKKISEIGYLPIEIKAIPEGTIIQSQNVLFTVENTIDEFYWLPGWIETLLMQVWYPITVATKSWEIKQIIRRYMIETHDNLESLPFKLHDFGYRGVESYQSAMIGGMAHLVSFMGTDTVAGQQGIWRWYSPISKCLSTFFNVDCFSIPAAEHSTITSWGKENEIKAYENMLDNFAKPESIVAVVSDSYDIYNAVEKIWGEQLNQKVVDSQATIVIRPDSGDPIETPIWCVEKLAEKFGYTLNQKGYKVLNNVRVIQGDGIDKSDVRSILEGLKVRGFSAENIAFGMGAGLLQKVNRDTFKFAYKCSARYDGKKWIDVYKQPVTSSWKKSKKGKLILIKENNKYKTVTIDEYPEYENILETCFKNGELVKNYSFNEIKERSENES